MVCVLKVELGEYVWIIYSFSPKVWISGSLYQVNVHIIHKKEKIVTTTK